MNLKGILKTLRIIKYRENILFFPFKYIFFLSNIKINYLKLFIKLKFKRNEKIDVLLINPPRWKIQMSNNSYIAKGSSKEEPMGLTSIYTFLETNKISVKILDWTVDPLSAGTLRLYIKALKPKVIGISAITLQANKAYLIGNYIKKEFPKINLVYGGVHPTFFPEEPFNLGSADFVVIGEGEQTFFELVEEIKRGNHNFKIKGLAYKKSDKIKINPSRKFIENINNLPLPNRTSLLMERYNTNLHIPPFDKEKAIPIMTSRGCPFNCSFCAIPNIWMRKFRQRSPERVIQEIKSVRDKYGVNNFHFYDDDFFVNTNFINKMCKLILKNDLKINWLCQTGASMLVKNASIPPLMRKAGCVIIELGIESCDKKVLDKINKPEAVKDIVDAIKILRKNRIKPLILMMAFNKGENLDSVYSTTLLLEKLGLWVAECLSKPEEFVNSISPAECNGTPYLHGFFATPIPGSEFYATAKEEGKIFMESWDDCYFQNINFIPNEFINDTPFAIKELDYNGFCNYLDTFRPILEHYLRYLNDITGAFSKLKDYKRFLFFLYNLSKPYNKSTIRELLAIVAKQYKKENIATICLGFRFLAMFKLIKSAKNQWTAMK